MKILALELESAVKAMLTHTNNLPDDSELANLRIQLDRLAHVGSGKYHKIEVRVRISRELDEDELAPKLF